MQYTFACPIEGCTTVMTVEAQDDEHALDQLVDQAAVHLAASHPDVHKTKEEIREDIAPKMKKSST